MKYLIEFRPKALKDLRNLKPNHTRRIVTKIRLLENDLMGDVKKLVDFDIAYRLRVGYYRVFCSMYIRTILLSTGSDIEVRHINMTKIQLHPEFLTKDGNREFAVLTYKEFLALEEWLEDARDLIEIRNGRETDNHLPNATVDDVEREFGMH